MTMGADVDSAALKFGCNHCGSTSYKQTPNCQRKKGTVTPYEFEEKLIEYMKTAEPIFHKSFLE